MLAAATRVSASVSVFFEAVTRLEDSFPLDATVQSCWRDLEKGTDESGRRAGWTGSLDRLEVGAGSHECAVGAGVSLAVSAVRLASEFWNTPRDGVDVVLAKAGDVAANLDIHGVADSEVVSTWAAYEESCVEQVISSLDVSSIFEIRLQAGMKSMPYRRAFQSWLQREQAI
jgi:hypothetical protein